MQQPMRSHLAPSHIKQGTFAVLRMLKVHMEDFVPFQTLSGALAGYPGEFQEAEDSQLN